MNDESLHEDLELEEHQPTPPRGSSLLKLQIPIKMPIPLRELTALIDSTEKQLKGAFGTKMSELVIRNAPGESMCFQFTLEIPKARTRTRAPRVRNRTPTGRGPGRPPKIQTPVED